MGLCGCFGSRWLQLAARGHQAGNHQACAAPGARAVLEESCISSFGFPMGQVQAINSPRMSCELKECLVLEGLRVLGRGHSGKPLGSFSGLPCPMLGVFLTELFGVPKLCPLVEPAAQDGRLPALGWGETPALLPVKLYLEIFSRQPDFSGFLTQNGV